MKYINYFVGLLIIISIFTSCTTSNKVVTDNIFQKRKYKKGFYVNKNNKKTKIDNYSFNTIHKDKSNPIKLNEPKFIPDDIELTASSDISDVIIESKDIKDNPDSCDIMILSNGDELVAKVTEIGLDVIKYKDCNNIDGPAIVIKKNDVFMIKYPNGTKTVISQVPNNNSQYSSTNASPQYYSKKIEVLSLLSFIFSIVGLIAFAILFGPAAVIIGIAGINKILKAPDKWQGKGFAIAGIIIGFVDIIAFFIIISSL